jgi:hypothetical protein
MCIYCIYFKDSFFLLPFPYASFFPTLLFSVSLVFILERQDTLPGVAPGKVLQAYNSGIE